MPVSSCSAIALRPKASISATTACAFTSLTPLQFQKQLRLVEARRLMLSRGEPISNAAYAVGYESVPQFTREYGRLFGLPPARDMRAAKTPALSAA
jgi:AraC-like DNA-binding protein